MSPKGIILSSSSQGATQEAVEKVLAEHGYEPDKPEVVTPEAPVEPKRDDFKTDAEFDAAQQEFETAQEKAEEEQAEKEEKEAQDRETREQQHRPSRKQRAVEKATKKLQDDLKAANDRIAALEGKKPAAAAAAETKLEAPKREAFKSDQEFDDAMFDYRYQLRRQKEQSQEVQKKLDERLKANYADYQTEVAAFKEEHDDWDEVVGKTTIVPDPVYYAIVDLGKDGPAVTYYLGLHPEEIDKLAEKTTFAATAIAVGRLADKLKAGEKPAPKVTQKPRPHIPEPVRPVRTAAAASTLTSTEAAKNRDFKSFKHAQRAGR